MTQTNNSTEVKTLAEVRSGVDGCLYGMEHRMLHNIRLDIVARASDAKKARKFVSLLAATDWDTFYMEKRYFSYDPMEGFGQHPF